MKVKGLADRVHQSWSEDMALERLVRAALHYRRSLYLAGKEGGKNISRKAMREVERTTERLLDVVFEMPPGLLRKVKRWRMDV